MKKIAMGVVVLIVGLAVGYGVTSVVKGAGGSQQKPPPARLVTVSGTATISTAPNEATVNFGVKTQAPDSQTASADNAHTMTAIMAALAKQGVSKSDVSTTDFRLYTQVLNRDTKQQTTVYVADNEIQVTVRDLTKTGSVIDAAVAAGATDVGGIQFKLSNQTNVRQQALEQAVKDAQAKAEAMARASGVTLGGIVSMRENVENNPIPYQYGNVFAAAPSPAPTTPVSPQQVQTQVTVTAVWDLSG